MSCRDKYIGSYLLLALSGGKVLAIKLTQKSVQIHGIMAKQKSLSSAMTGLHWQEDRSER